MPDYQVGIGHDKILPEMVQQLRVVLICLHPLGGLRVYLIGGCLLSYYCSEDQPVLESEGGAKDVKISQLSKIDLADGFLLLLQVGLDYHQIDCWGFLILV